MSLIEHEVDIRTGRRNEDGHLRLSIFANEMVALAVEGHGERVPTLLLTIEQAQRLQSTLAELITLVGESKREEINAGTWRGEERRRLAS